MRFVSQHRFANVNAVTLTERASDPLRGMVVAGAQFEVEGTVAELNAASVMQCASVWEPASNWAVLHYQARALATNLPHDDNVVYGHIDGLGHIVHESELPA